MGNASRNYSQKTIARLFALSGNQCSFPGCTQILVNENNAKNGNICHIEAANPGGERYRTEMSNKERADYDNLILLCIQHHDETNNIDKYTVDVLKKMKREHISNQLNQKINNKPSMLRNIINAISSIDIDENIKENNIDEFNIRDKISYNRIKKYAPLIQEYKVYHHKINALYDELEVQGSLKKNKVLSNINNYYLKAKGRYLNDPIKEMNQIRNYADDIIDNVLENLYSNLEESSLFEEDIMLGVDLIMVDAFMRCKILEKPD